MERTSRDRRKARRIPINLEIEVQIMHPHDTIGKKSFTGRVSNINERDARITVFDLPSTYYQKLIKDRDLRFIRMTCKFPTSEEESRLFGRILYFDYHGKAESKFCEIAMQFWELDESERQRLKEFLVYLKDRSSGTARRRITPGCGHRIMRSMIARGRSRTKAAPIQSDFLKR